MNFEISSRLSNPGSHVAATFTNRPVRPAPTDSAGQNEVPQGRQSRHHHPRPLRRQEGTIIYENSRESLPRRSTILNPDFARRRGADEGHPTSTSRSVKVFGQGTMGRKSWRRLYETITNCEKNRRKHRSDQTLFTLFERPIFWVEGIHEIYCEGGQWWIVSGHLPTHTHSTIPSDC